MSCSYSASVAPARIAEKYAGKTSGTSTPTRPVRPAESPRALRFAV